jgi:hypothetical protein
MGIWFPDKKLVVVSSQNKTVIDMLPESLKMKFLSAKDHRIVKVTSYYRIH